MYGESIENMHPDVRVLKARYNYMHMLFGRSLFDALTWDASFT